MKIEIVLVSLCILLLSVSCYHMSTRRAVLARRRRMNILKDSMTECSDFEKDVLVQSLSTPVIVDFAADWCGPCKLIAPIFKKIAEEFEGVKFVKVDTETYEDAIDAYKIQGLPLISVFKDRNMIASQAGAMTSSTLREFVQKSVG